MVIIDTTVWIDYFRGTVTEHTTWLDRELATQRLGLTDLILCEILQGIQSDPEFIQVQRDLVRLEIFSTGGEHLTVAAARNCRTLRKRGSAVRKTIDCLIATFCLEAGHSLLHCDRDFDPFEKHLELQVVHP